MLDSADVPVRTLADSIGKQAQAATAAKVDPSRRSLHPPFQVSSSWMTRSGEHARDSALDAESIRLFTVGEHGVSWLSMYGRLPRGAGLRRLGAGVLNPLLRLLLLYLTF